MTRRESQNEPDPLREGHRPRLRERFRRAGLSGFHDYEIRDGERLVTVPDFTWEERNWLQAHGWAVLTYWGRTVLKDPDACAGQMAEVYFSRASVSGGR